jgi:hypothetical protein
MILQGFRGVLKLGNKVTQRAPLNGGLSWPQRAPLNGGLNMPRRAALKGGLDLNVEQKGWIGGVLGAAIRDNKKI